LNFAKNKELSSLFSPLFVGRKEGFFGELYRRNGGIFMAC